ncbi:MAG: protein tyrosine phosphatase family protein [Bacteroidetes bacterium]|nr:protein tyrosine phosphatase family protein [Bacteroidota bacterium]
MAAIYNFYQVNERLACAGQPREGQLASIAEEGYETIINLGLHDGKYALADEAASVKALGMTYCYIPVQFDNPRLDELDAFITEMRLQTGKKVFVHCAANYRASCFTGLYLLATDQLTVDEMNDLINNIWQPDTVWQQFIDDGVDHLVK